VPADILDKISLDSELPFI